MGKPVRRTTDARVVGPLAPYAVGFRNVLRALGYAPGSAEHQMRLMAHLERLALCRAVCRARI